jgi:hypothetical protein
LNNWAHDDEGSSLRRLVCWMTTGLLAHAGSPAEARGVSRVRASNPKKIYDRPDLTGPA